MPLPSRQALPRSGVVHSLRPLTHIDIRAWSSQQSIITALKLRRDCERNSCLLVAVEPNNDKSRAHGWYKAQI